MLKDLCKWRRRRRYILPLVLKGVHVIFKFYGCSGSTEDFTRKYQEYLIYLESIFLKATTKEQTICLDFTRKQLIKV
jgi:hypothetical protein